MLRYNDVKIKFIALGVLEYVHSHAWYKLCNYVMMFKSGT